MTEEQKDNMYLDVVGVLRDFEADNDNVYIYIQGTTLSDTEITTAVNVAGGYDLMVDMFVAFIEEDGNDIGRAMLDALDIINDEKQRHGKEKAIISPSDN